MSTHRLHHQIHIQATPDIVWDQVIDVDIAAFDHPRYFVLLDIPKPLRAEVQQRGVGGRRVAHFAGGHRFSQLITAWEPNRHYAFTFSASPGFRVAYLLDLASGPFRMAGGSYVIEREGGGVRLTLTSDYELHGLVGRLLFPPVRLTLELFQRYLLRGIKANSERMMGR